MRKTYGEKIISHNANGDSKEKLYEIYTSIIRRCHNQNQKSFKYYGGRGIKICDEWFNNYQSFKKWALENGYVEGLTIDRIDVNGNYEPSNCRWITKKEQQNNTRRNCFITYNGETKTISQWGEFYEIPYHILWRRLKENWDLEEAFGLKKRKRKTGKENKLSKPVNQYDLEGNFIRTWENILSVEKELKLNHSLISACCKKRRKHTGGYVWRYVKDDEMS